MPASAYMPTGLRWQLAYIFDEIQAAFWSSLTIRILQDKAPALSTWMCEHPEAHDMVTLLRQMAPRIEETYQEQRAQRKNTVVDMVELAIPAQRCTTLAEYTTAMRVRDDTLSRRVALQEAKKATLQAQQEERQRERIEQQQESSLASQWIQGYITGVVDEPENPPAGVTDYMLRAARGIRQARSSMVEDQLSRLESQQSIDSHQPQQSYSSQTPSTPEIESDTQMCAPLESIDTPRKAVKRRRGPLELRDANHSIGLSYSPTTSSGRKRILTSKGKENMRH